MKKLTCLVLILTMVCSFWGLTATAEATANNAAYYGDYDRNGKINASDALEILKITVGKTALNYDTMHYLDVNVDYKINAGDALEILKYSVGKVQTFKAVDDFTGLVDLVNNDIYLQKGGTASMGVWCLSPEDFQIFYSANAKGVLEINWDSCGWIFDNRCAILNISSLISVTKETVIQVNVYYKDHPSVYEVVNVHLMPEQTTPFSYATYPGVPDLGDYMQTAPEWIQTEVVNSEGVDYYTTSLCYDVKTILSNVNDTNIYKKFNDYCSEKMTFIGASTNSDGYNVNDYKTDKYHLRMWLQNVDGNQKLFVYLQSKVSDI